MWKPSLNQTAACVLGGMFSTVSVYLDSKVKREDDEADHLDALSETAGRLPGWRAISGV